MPKRLDIAMEAVTKTGEYLRQHFLQQHQVSWKEDQTVLLGEDLEAEKILLDTIHTAFPHDSFLTEETETEIGSDLVWVFDPLCGSYSYLRGVETWSVSAALIDGDKYKIGVVYQPYSRNLYFSEQGQGAFMNSKSIHVAPTDKIKDAFISIEHGVFNTDKVDLKKIIKDIKRLRVGHGSGGELAYVAAGFVDGVIKTDQALMHFAGGRAVVEAAGGEFIDFQGNRAPTYLDRNKTTDYIACTPKLKERLLKFILK